MALGDVMVWSLPFTYGMEPAQAIALLPGHIRRYGDLRYNSFGVGNVRDLSVSGDRARRASSLARVGQARRAFGAGVYCNARSAALSGP